MKEEDIKDCLKTYKWTRSYLDNTNGRERLKDYVHYVAKVCHNYLTLLSFNVYNTLKKGFFFKERVIFHGRDQAVR